MATTDAEEKPKSNRLVVLNAITDLCNANRQASRRAICDYTGLPMSIVDDHVRNLKDEEIIRAVMPGVFEPIDQSVDRPVSATFVQNGRFKLEIGDQVLDLTLREARAVAVVTGGVLALGR
jgi:hypothetical protein